MSRLHLREQEVGREKDDIHHLYLCYQSISMCRTAAEIRPSEGMTDRLEGGFLLMPQRDNTQSLESNFYTRMVPNPPRSLSTCTYFVLGHSLSHYRCHFFFFALTQSPLLPPPAQIAETYAFLPREAVTRFLMSCGECQKRMHINPSTAEFKGNGAHAHLTCGRLTNPGHIIN